jgi:hypothetical protein
MKINQIIICLFILLSKCCFSQEKIAKDLFFGSLSYGFETNYGNTGFLFGIGYQKNISSKFIYQSDIHYFTSEIIDVNFQYYKDFPEEERYYRSIFLSGALGYALIGKTDKFNVTINGGLSLCYFNSRNLRFYTFFLFPDGSSQVIPSSIRYYNENRIVGAYNLGFDVNFPIKKNQVITLGTHSYSGDLFLQFLFFPVLSYKLRLK